MHNALDTYTLCGPMCQVNSTHWYTWKAGKAWRARVQDSDGQTHEFFFFSFFPPTCFFFLFPPSEWIRARSRNSSFAFCKIVATRDFHLEFFVQNIRKFSIQWRFLWHHCHLFLPFGLYAVFIFTCSAIWLVFIVSVGRASVNPLWTKCIYTTCT